MQKYHEIESIGSGAHGSVMKMQIKQSGSIVAVKKVKKSISQWKDIFVMEEIKVLTYLSHKNIIQLKEVVKENNTLFLVMECLETNLLNFIQGYKLSNRNVPIGVAKNIMYQLFNGLDYLHSNSFVHRDIKPENLVLSKDGFILKIADFGLCQDIGLVIGATYVATRWYRAPEVILQCGLSTGAIDIFSSACVLAELLLLNPLFPGVNELDMLVRFSQVMGPATESDWKDGVQAAIASGVSLPTTMRIPLEDIFGERNENEQPIELLKACLQWRPTARPTASLCLNAFHFFDVDD